MTAFYSPREERWAEENRQAREQTPGWLSLFQSGEQLNESSLLNALVEVLSQPAWRYPAYANWQPDPTTGSHDFSQEEPTISPIPIEDAK